MVKIYKYIHIKHINGIKNVAASDLDHCSGKEKMGLHKSCFFRLIGEEQISSGFLFSSVETNSGLNRFTTIKNKIAVEVL